MWTCIEESVNDNGALFQHYTGRIGDPMRVIVYSPDEGVSVWDMNGRKSFGSFASIEAAFKALDSTL